MTHKTLEISEDTYACLESLKRPNETWDSLLQHLSQTSDRSAEETPFCARCYAYLADWIEVGGDPYCRDCAEEIDPSTIESSAESESTSEPVNQDEGADFDILDFLQEPANQSIDQDEASTQGKTFDNYGGLREDTVWMVDDETPITRWPLSLERKWWSLAEKLGERHWFTSSRNRFGSGNDDRERERYFRSPPELQRKWYNMTQIEFLSYIIRSSNSDHPPYWNYSIDSLRQDGWPEEVLQDVEARLG